MVFATEGSTVGNKHCYSDGTRRIDFLECSQTRKGEHTSESKRCAVRLPNRGKIGQSVCEVGVA